MCAFLLVPVEFLARGAVLVCHSALSAPSALLLVCFVGCQDRVFDGYHNRRATHTLRPLPAALPDVSAGVLSISYFCSTQNGPQPRPREPVIDKSMSDVSEDKWPGNVREEGTQRTCSCLEGAQEQEGLGRALPCPPPFVPFWGSPAW